MNAPTRSTARGHRSSMRRVLAVVSVSVVVLAGCGDREGNPPASSPLGPVGEEAGHGVASADVQTPEEPATAGASPTAAPGAPSGSATGEVDAAAEEPAASAPVRVRVPSIGVDSGLIDLGLTPDGRMEAPEDPDDVGWFVGGSTPGQVGSKVIAAHVDGPDGPAAFYELPQLAPGDEVEVERADGETVRYVVTAVSDHPKDDFPTAAVFGASNTDQLRLVTCTGPWDPVEESYTDNRVVYADAVDA